ncbi:permease [Rickettsia tamurae]
MAILMMLLHGSENTLDVIPWLDHGIQKNNKKY